MRLRKGTSYAAGWGPGTHLMQGKLGLCEAQEQAALGLVVGVQRVEHTVQLLVAAQDCLLVVAPQEDQPGRGRRHRPAVSTACRQRGTLYTR